MTALRQVAAVAGPSLLVQAPHLHSLLEGGQIELVEVSAGQALWLNGEVLDGDVICITGLLKLTLPGRSGRIARLVLSGELAGSNHLLPNAASLGTLVAATDSLVLRFNEAALRRWLDFGPDAGMNLLRYQALMLERAHRQLCVLTEGTVAARLARLLLLLADRAPSFSDGGLELHLTQAEIASLVGARRETVARQLNTWRRSGLVSFERGGAWTLDVRKLELEAEGPELDWRSLKL